MERGQINQSTLGDAWKALILLGETIEEGFHGDVEGIDTVDVGLQAMASALDRLLSFPEAKGARGPDIEEVLAYLVSVGRVGDKALDAARRLAAGIKQARYEPLQYEDVEDLEEARSELYGELEALLSEVEKEVPGG
jgi:hypothetical protein